MADSAVKTIRCHLEQDFPTEAEGVVETHHTAMISIVGNSALEGFAQQLAAFNHGARRFVSICNPCVAGRWTASDVEPPSYGAGLIFVTEDSVSALSALTAEVTRYWTAGITPFVVSAGRLQWIDTITERLVGFDRPWHHVRMQSGGASESPEMAGPSGAAIAYVEALIVGAIYPAAFVVDLADVISAFDTDSPHIKILRFQGKTREELVERIDSDRKRLRQSRGGLLTLLTPSDGKFKKIHGDTTVISHALPDLADPSRSWIWAQIADTNRDHYTLYAACND